MSIEFIADTLDGDGEVDFNLDLNKFDLDGDGTITANDCPFPDGSSEAKLWWKNIMEPYVKSQIKQEWIDEYGDRVVGGYEGKPLVPGEAGQNQGDFNLLVDKIKVTQGLSYSSAVKIAGKIKMMRYG